MAGFVFLSGVLVTVALVVAAFWSETKLPPSVTKVWLRGARALGLDYAVINGAPTLDGNMGVMGVHVDTFKRGKDGRSCTRVVIDSHGRVPDGLLEDLDDGETPAALVRREAQRIAMRLAKDHGATIGGGRITWVGTGIMWKPSAFVSSVKGIVQVAERLAAPPAETPAALLAGIKDKRTPASERVKMAQALLDEYSDSPYARVLAKSVLYGREQRLRLSAAKIIGGREGNEVLHELAMAQSTDDGPRREALEILAATPKGLGRDEWWGLLLSSSKAIATVAHDVLRQTRHPDGLAAAREVVSRPDAPRYVLEPCLDTLCVLGDRKTIPLLRDFRESDDVSLRKLAKQTRERILANAS